MHASAPHAIINEPHRKGSLLMKFTGDVLSERDVINLKRGDVYFHELGNSPRIFDHYSNGGNIINSDGKLNKMDNIRWLSADEKSKWEKIRPDLFTFSKSRKTTKQPEAEPMSNYDTQPSIAIEKEEVSFMDRFKTDTVDAGYRVAATQVGKAVKGGIVMALEKKGADNAKVAAVKDLLESEAGTAILQVLLGYGLTYMPGMKDDARVERLAKEFRIDGTAVAGNLVVGTAMEFILPAVQEAMKSLPALPSITEKAKSRVSAPLTALPKKTESLADAIEESEQETEEVVLKRAKA